MRKTIVPLLTLTLVMVTAIAAAETPSTWIDPKTGHRVVRLSTEAGSSTLYFHDTAYTPQGDKFIFNTPSGVAAVDVAKIGTGSLKPDIVVPSGGRGTIMARRTREVYISRGGQGGGQGT